MLGDSDLKITPRSKSIAVANGITVSDDKIIGTNSFTQARSETKLLSSRDEQLATEKIAMTPEKAATLIQGLYRTRVARKRLWIMCASVYEKVFDEASGKFFCKYGCFE